MKVYREPNVWIASMEPQFKDCGNRGIKAEILKEGTASMEPQFKDCGNMASLSEIRAAVGSLQWSRSSKTAETEDHEQ